MHVETETALTVWLFINLIITGMHLNIESMIPGIPNKNIILTIFEFDDVENTCVW